MIGDLIRRKRLLQRMTQAELARRVGYSQPYIGRLEKGDIKLPREDALRRFSEVLNIPIPDLHRAAGIEGEELETAKKQSTAVATLIAKLLSNKELSHRIEQARSQRTPEQWAVIEERLAELCNTVFMKGIDLADLPGRQPELSGRREQILALVGIASDTEPDVASLHDQYLTERSPHAQP